MATNRDLEQLVRTLLMPHICHPPLEQTRLDGCAALTELAERLEAAEHERDNARTERNGVETDVVSLAAQLAGFKALYEECRSVLRAAEAREAAAVKALEEIDAKPYRAEEVIARWRSAYDPG